MHTRPRIRQLTLGELLDETFRIYRRDLVTLIALAACVIVPYAILDLLVSFPFLQHLVQVQQGTVDAMPPEAGLSSLIPSTLVGAGPSIGVGIFYTVVFEPVMEGALTQAVTRRYLNQPVSVGTSMGMALRRAVPLIVARFLPSLIFIIPALLFVGVTLLPNDPDSALEPLGLLGMVCVIPLLSLGLLAVYVRVLFTSQAIIAEGLGPRAALRRSWGLVNDYGWRTLGCVIVIIIVSWLIQSIPDAIIRSLLERVVQDGGRQVLVTAMVNTVTTIVITPFALITYTLLYYDLRIRKEGFDLEQQARMVLVEPGSSDYGAAPNA